MRLIHKFLAVIFMLNQSKAEKFTTDSMCLDKVSRDSHNKLKCETQSHVLYITLVQYANDFVNQCNSAHTELTTNSTPCVAYPTQSLADFCNGKNECLVKLDQPEFKFGMMGSNCDFVSKILTINYECIPSMMLFFFFSLYIDYFCLKTAKNRLEISSKVLLQS
jgi:hypothetical protein